MGISSALHNAASGLSASSRLADTVANNVANALTPGYSKRVAELSSLSLGGYGSGVRVTGTTRSESVFVTAERRGMDAAAGQAGALSDAYGRLAGALGEPGETGALATRATALETALMSAVAAPQSLTELTDAVARATGLAESLNAVADETIRLRSEADAEIARQVGVVNGSLNAIRDLNAKITTLRAAGGDISALRDEQDRLVDQIATIIPVRAVKREGDQMAVYSANGGALLDGRVWELGFQRGPSIVTPEMGVGSPLGVLTQDQGGLSRAPAGGSMDGGSLSALFQIRDEIAPQFQAEIDRYATELIDRFRSLAPAARDAAGNGLFVDGGTGVGAAGRITVNAAVDPTQGGAAWRLRDGLAAASPGAEGNGAILQALADAMSTARPATGWVSQNAASDAATMASEISSFFAARAATGDEARAFLAARQSTLAEGEAGLTGVDTDAELQNLTLVQQAFAANARVLSVIDELMQLLLRA